MIFLQGTKQIRNYGVILKVKDKKIVELGTLKVEMASRPETQLKKQILFMNNLTLSSQIPSLKSCIFLTKNPACPTFTE